MSRRAWLGWFARAAAAAGAGALRAAAFAQPASPPLYPPVLPGRALAFPYDHGAHPQYRTEWWYVTGWLRDGGRDLGVQVTFFRSRTVHDERNPSAFAPLQLVLAHAALAVDGESALRHGQRAARAGFGLAHSKEGDTDALVDGWRLARDASDRYRTRIDAREFALELVFSPRDPPVLQGEAGFSRKGPLPQQASYYYSRPQLAVAGRVRLGGPDAAPREVDGVAWLDHEWSSELLDPRAAGWDWVGLNLDDGSALMAFRIRTPAGEELWSHARWLHEPHDAAAPQFQPLGHWRSLRSGARYPVRMRVSVGARTLELRPLFDDQELDTRASTGTIYWEGAVRAYENGRVVGRGYLELTGYAGTVRL